MKALHAAGRLSPGLWLCFVLVLTHLGLALLVDVSERMAAPSARARARDRPQSSRAFCSHFCLRLCAGAGIDGNRIVFTSGRLGPLDRIAPLVVLSGLAVIVGAGDKVLLYRERLVSSAWLGLLVVPPVLGRACDRDCSRGRSGSDLRIAQPAKSEGGFYADIYQRRTGKPLAYLTGDPRIAPLVALAAPSRPHSISPGRRNAARG